MTRTLEPMGVMSSMRPRPNCGMADEIATAEFTDHFLGLFAQGGGLAFPLLLGAAGVEGLVAVAERTGTVVLAGGEIDELKAFVRHFLEELGGDGAERFAANHAVAGVGEGEMFHGTGDADEAKAAFFFHVIRTAAHVEGAGMGDQSIFDTDNGDPGKLEPFSGMQGHECDGAAGVFDFVDIGGEGDLFKKVVEGAQGIDVFKFRGNIDEFFNVGGTFNVLVVILFAEVGLKAGFLVDAVEKRADAIGGEKTGCRVSGRWFRA